MAAKKNGLQAIKLFTNLNFPDDKSLIAALGGKIKKAAKGEILLLAGDKPKEFGVILGGELHIVKEDYQGNRTIVAALSPGDIFAEVLCCAAVSHSPVTVQAATAAQVLLLDYQAITNPAAKNEELRSTFMANMLQMMAAKNLFLQNRLEITALKSLRAKVLRFLQWAQKEQGQVITIDFNREEMADYLCVERTALSHELSRLKKEGIIDYHKNHFTLK